MARFRFPLHRLLRVRELGEELARNELLAAEALVQEAERRLASAREQVRFALAHIAQLQAAPQIEAELVLAAQRSVPALERRARVHEQALASARAAADVAREAWQVARVDKRALERLEERAKGVFRESERALEDKALQEQVDRKAALTGLVRRKDEV
jgi:flagellar export protein FliJ